MNKVFVVPPVQRPNRVSGNRVYPIFSDEDADLRDEKWRDDNGYAVVTRGKKLFSAHKIVLARKIGRWPGKGELTDHRNRNRLDNRRRNIRLATYSQNGQNRGIDPRNTSGHRSVCWHKVARKWVVLVRLNGKCNYGGLFVNLSEAVDKARQMRNDFGFWGDD